MVRCLTCLPKQVRARWRAVTSNPEFWSEINLKGRTVQVSKVRCAVAAGPGWCCAAFAGFHWCCAVAAGCGCCCAPLQGQGEAACWLLVLCSDCRVWLRCAWFLECPRLLFILFPRIATATAAASSPASCCCCLLAEARSHLPHSYSQVRHLLSQHNGVKVLNARGVAFAPSDLAFLLPQLT